MVMYSIKTQIQSVVLYPMYGGMWGGVRVTGGSDWK